MTNKLMFKMSNQRVYRAVNGHIFLLYALHGDVKLLYCNYYSFSILCSNIKAW